MSRKTFQKVENLNPAFPARNASHSDAGGRWRDVPKAIWYFLENDNVNFTVSIIILFAIFFYEFIPSVIAGKIVDFFSNYHAGDSLRYFYSLVIFLSVSFIIASLIRLEVKRNVIAIGHRLRARARIWGFERLMEFSLQWHAKENSGNKIERIFTGSQSLREWTRQITRDILRFGSIFIGIFGFFLFISPIFAVFIFLYIAIFVGIMVIYNKRIFQLSARYNVLKQSASGMYVEGTGNIMAIKALGSGNQIGLHLKNKEVLVQDQGIARSNAGFTKYKYLRFMDGIFWIIFFMLISKSFLAGQITTGTILVLFTFYVRLRESMTEIDDISESLIELRSDLGAMMPIFLEQTHVPTGHEKFPMDWRTIGIKQGMLAYPSGQIGLSNLNLEIRRGEKLGIAGSSGGGKSTLVKVLLGLYRFQEGSFTVGDKNYYDISHEDLIKHLSVVLQETELFNISLRENITMMREENPELLQKAIEISQLTEVIAKLPQGVDTLIGERGYMLSGGERQRLGIARAIYKNSEVMIFDEATSSLDSETERKIMEGLLGDFGKSRTMIIVAHRLSTLANTNRVVVFEEGTVVEEGTYRELLDNSESVLAKLSKTQTTPSEEGDRK